MWILIIEDEEKLARTLQKGLREEGHSVAVVHNGCEGLEAATTRAFDGIILDLMLPAMDGFEVLQRLRQVRNQTPLLILTARDSVDDIVRGFDLGADDYLTKPFGFQELLARLRNMARHGPASQSDRLQVADLVLDPATHEVYRGKRQISLTPTEYRLLEFLMSRARRVVSRSAILEAIWGLGWEVGHNTLEVFIKSLRDKVDCSGHRRLIHTIRGFGYCVREPENRKN